MKYVKILLVLLLAATAGLYSFQSVSEGLRGENTPPVIECSADPLEVSVRDPESALFAGLTASDKQDGDLTDHIYLTGLSKMVGGTVKATYYVFDSDNNMASRTRQIRYTDYQSPRIEIVQPLIYSTTDSITLLDRLQVIDTIDGDITKSIRVSSLTMTEISGVYSVTLQVTNSMGDTVRVEVPVIQVERGASQSIIQLSKQLVYLSQGSSFNPRTYLLTVDTPNGPGTPGSVQIHNPVDMSTPGTYQVRYDYHDEETNGLAYLTVVVE